MTVQVHLLHQAAPINLENVKNTYQKGDLFCVMLQTGLVYKFPIVHLFRVAEQP